MAALVAPGAPVSVLIDYGLAEKVVEKLLESSVGTIEKLGGMTPEELEEIQGIDPGMVEQIQFAVNAYYSQFEDPAAAEEAGAAAEEETEPVEALVEEAEVEAEAVEPEAAEVQAVEAEAEESADQSGTIENAGSPPNNQAAGADPDGPGLEESTPEEGSH
jgi:N utilization substance protein A